MYEGGILKNYKARNSTILLDTGIRPKTGLVLDIDFHLSNKWVVALTPYWMNAIINEFNCVIIRDQKDYDEYKDVLDVIISTSPGWSAPHIEYEKEKPKLKYIIIGDPHREQAEKQQYFVKNDFSYALVHYFNPAIFHLNKISKEKILHCAWPVSDELIAKTDIINRNQDKILIFGAAEHKAYETRNWCKNFDFVENFHYSGVENKELFGSPYFRWLEQFDAAIAAGSLEKKYQLVVPKYFEIASAGCLLFAQEAEDLKLLGFKDNINCIIFNKENFEEKARDYLRNKEGYLAIREAGRNLIRERHTVSKKIEWLKMHVIDNLKKK